MIESWTERLERDAASQSCVVCEIDYAHPAASELSSNDVRADDSAFARVLSRIGRRTRDRVERDCLPEIASVPRNQVGDFGAELRVADTCALEVLVALLRIPFERGRVDPTHSHQVVVQGHGCGGSS
jgi:hypothetical protein